MKVGQCDFVDCEGVGAHSATLCILTEKDAHVLCPDVYTGWGLLPGKHGIYFMPSKYYA